MLTWELLFGLPLAALLLASTGSTAASSEEGGEGGSTSPSGGAAASEEKEKDKTAEGGKPAAGGEPETITLPADEVLAMQRDKQELERRRAENARLRDRLRRRGAAEDDGQDRLTLEGVATAFANAVKESRAPVDEPVIPGLEIKADGDATYMGSPVDPGLARLIMQFRRDGSSHSSSLAQIQQRLDQLSQRFEEQDRLSAESAEAASLAEIADIEQRHVTRMRTFGTRLCDKEFSDLAPGMRRVARDAYEGKLDKVFVALEDRGVQPEELTPELVSRISDPILKELREGLKGAPADTQGDKAEDAREKQPLKRGGTVAEPGRPDPTKMTLEEREKWVDQQAKEVADLVHGEGPRPGQVEEGYPNY